MVVGIFYIMGARYQADAVSCVRRTIKETLMDGNEISVKKSIVVVSCRKEYAEKSIDER